MRPALIVFAAAVLAAGTGSSAVAQQRVTAARDVVVHEGPSRSTVQVGVLREGAAATLLSHRGGYDRVQLDDSTTGWAYARYLRPDTSAASPAGRRPPPQTGAPASAGSSTLAAVPKPAPKEEHAAACADIGSPNRAGTPVDTNTNLLKNRIDDGQYQAVSFGAVLDLPWQGLARRRYQWTDAQRRQVAVDEGGAIALTGYLVAVKPEGPEQTNCELPDVTWHDWHMWLVATSAEAVAHDRTKAVVVEVTPRVRRLDAGRFDLQQIQQWIGAGQRVRVSGWLLLDPDHPDQVGKTRGTIWEIHPVMKIEAVP